ncbi:MAG: 23S rRNA (uracil(1939)-C(5))-methyltransferase RlmD [Synergistaceae bacterium]|jgi:23S rRNA (uracil1939-C5)-methyltransferase|nr:23S rRNA (uracil(1939)-C(5))-methyltransferase RlmD [Synergistaceae bacterium]
MSSMNFFKERVRHEKEYSVPVPLVMELSIEKVSSDGRGIARTKDGVVFVAGALPGELVEAEITSRKRDFASARVLRVLEPNPRRVRPRCPVSCGSCQLQHASYDLQLEIKAQIVQDALTRIGGFGPLTVQCEPSPRQWGYRNKASFPVRKIKGKPVMGFYQADSHRLTTLQSCPVNAGPLNQMFSVLRNELPGLELDVYDERAHRGALRHVILRAGLRTGQTLASLVVNGRLTARNVNSIAGLSRSLKNLTTLTLNHNSRPGNVILGERTEALKGDGRISERLDDWVFHYDTTSFFQINTAQAERLCRHVKEQTENDGEPGALELYSGVGSLTCCLAGSGPLTAVEEWGSAFTLMERNLRDNGVSNVRALRGRAEELIKNKNLEGRYGLVALDPPRSGCARVVLDKILEFRPERVLYVSCNPATLARDAKILGEGGYCPTSIRVFDMFPQTAHVETALSLRFAPTTRYKR